jgi:hypothetical protein
MILEWFLSGGVLSQISAFLPVLVSLVGGVVWEGLLVHQGGVLWHDPRLCVAVIIGISPR